MYIKYKTLFQNIYLLGVCAHYICHSWVWRSEDSSQKLVLTFHRVGSGDRTQGVRHSTIQLFMLSLTRHLKEN